jgi:hypothetical protein
LTTSPATLRRAFNVALDELERSRGREPAHAGYAAGCQSAVFWAGWRALADSACDIVRHQNPDTPWAGIVPKLVIPDSDDEIAKLCLREACVIALGPGGDLRTKLGALGTVLKYTRPKPAQRQSVTATGTSEDWLRTAIMAGSIAAGAGAEAEVAE